MKFQVGDKVKVHTKEWFEKNCYINNAIGSYVLNRKSNSVISDMINFCGQEVTICKVNADNYRISEDKRWYWEDWMFEDMNNGTHIISNPNIVEDFAKLIGVELDEEFYDEDYDYRYKITSTDGVMFYNTNTKSWQAYTEYCINTFFKMIKEGKFIKKWMPKYGDTVYFPSFCCKDLWSYITYDSEKEHDKEMLKNGLYFRTQEEAVECAKKIIKQMKEG